MASPTVGFIAAQVSTPLFQTTGGFSWTDWHGHPSVLIGLLLLQGAYLFAVGPLRRRTEWRLLTDFPVTRSQVVSFTLGALAIFLALHSPLHELSDRYLFSAHMVQHLLLMLVAPPLLVLGIPTWLLRWPLRFPLIWHGARFLTRPLVALLLFSAILGLWHLPTLYDVTLRQHNIHMLEHLMFMVAAVLMWWPILSPLPELPRLAYPLQMLYLFVLSLLPAVVGAIITFSGDVLYGFYAEAPRVWGISPLLDQQMGGLIMKVGGSLVFWLALVIIFFKWFDREEAAAREPEGEVEPAPPEPLPSARDLVQDLERYLREQKEGPERR